MASREQLDSWQKTTAFLRDARSNLSEAAEGICCDEIAEFEGSLRHNELELALDSLEAVVAKSALESLRVIELMISAAQSMGLEQRVARYKKAIEQAHLSTSERWQKWLNPRDE